MAFPTKYLNKNEEIVLDLRPHWWYMVSSSSVFGLAVLIVILLVAADAPSALGWVAGIGLVAALVWVVSKYLRWVSTNFVVTNERLIYRSGVLAKRGIEIPLDRINTVHFRQGMIERLLGQGDLRIESASELGQQTFSNVRQPNAVQQEIYRAMEEEEQRRIDRYGQAAQAPASAAPAPAPEQSIPEKIDQLNDLRAKGAITEEEYQRKKQDLLDRM